MSSLEEKQRWRLKFMKQLYEVADGSPMKPVGIFDIGTALGIANDEVLEVYQYLENEELVKGYGAGPLVVLTHRGVKETEGAIQRPDQGTEHFPGTVVLTVMGDVNAPMQVANIQSHQQVEYISQAALGDLRRWLDDVRRQVANLPEDQRDDASAQIESAEAQLKARRPSRQVLGAAIGTLLGTLRAGLQTGVAAGAEDAIKHFIEHPPALGL